MKVIKQTKKGLLKIKTLLKQSSIVAFCTLLSRVAGYIREIFLTSWMGAGVATDAIIIATRISTLLRKTSSEGALSNILIPTIGELERNNKKELAISLINLITLSFCTIFILLNIIYLICPNILLNILALGKTSKGETLLWIKSYLPYTNATVVLFFIYGITSAMLNYHNKFFWAAIAPAIWNIIIIASVIYTNYYNLSYEMFGPILFSATLIQTLITIIAYLSLKIPFTIKFNKELKQHFIIFFKKFFPVMLATGVIQINSIIVITIASAVLEQGAATLIFRAEKILQIPITLTIPLTSTLLPALSKKTYEASTVRKGVLVGSTLITIPMAVLGYCFCDPLIKTMFNYGKSTANDLNTMANLFRIYTFAIPAYFLIRILPIFFFAQKTTKIPTIAAVLNTTINTVLGIILVKNIGISGIAIAGVISSYAHFVFLYIKSR